VDYLLAMHADEDSPFKRSVFDCDYWLSHSVGLGVDAPRGRLGVVEEVRFASRIDRPDLLVVRSGRFGRRRFIISVEDVEEVRPRAKRLRLRAAPPLRSAI
jgi:hypothetical protein